MSKSVNQSISTEQIEDIRGQMMKFALLQLQNSVIAEDLVQETFSDALKNIDSFQRKSALKTWIFAILKNKILDYFRYKERFVLESELSQDDEYSPNTFFDEKGHWKTGYYPDVPNVLLETENAVYSEEFWLIFEACLTHLPAKQARVFMMREFFDLGTQDICNQIQITAKHFHVLMYRARLQLQRCLSIKLHDD
ncbi:sigma-70 family RNA polymerase sigma factor [Exercitatus varius]|uniref:sigma-70 family RNA polymerase sigma factor n=1 Tax=Exercitatus varius TaxID=67857 RepID=UPI00294B64AF|nr:sigma-70 family RNA polymerase sigma factor [Exercitatus varius]MDG2944777.1 sigma-70 family RNA polymerase sigma factor [Exercitatus varius]MDG2958900.1 sigma-70 family RNA polymerase sigma factor [Exercitatus varius]